MMSSLTGAALLVTVLAAPAAAQPARFDDVVRNLRHPDPKVRLAAVKLLREAKYPEAIVPMAALISDPVDAIQLEAIGAELSFFLVDEVPARRRLGFLVEVRNRGGAVTAFEMGPLAVWPKVAPPQVIDALLKAVDDENARVRLEAIYAVGVLGGRAPLPPDAEPLLLKALDHYDPEVREGAARVAGRLRVNAAGEALIKAVNDSSPDVRYAAMRALGMIRDERAINALTEQLEYYGKGEGAWSALDALARIAHPSSAKLFAARLGDRDPHLRRAAAEGLGRLGDRSALSALEPAIGGETAPTARAAMAFALQLLGRESIPRLVEFLDDAKTTLQVQDYLLELGPGVEKALLPNLQDPDESIRAAVADVLGEIGGEASLAALQAMAPREGRGEKATMEAVTRAIERIRMRQGRQTP